VPRPLVLEKFSDDEGASVLSVPLHQRRAAIQEIPWVERASVRRVLPNRIRVDIVERTPVAFLRTGSELGLIDANGVILERPLEGDFRFPVVTGINENTPSGERRKRMQAFVQFLNDVELARTGAGEFVSEVDLADPDDLRVVLTGLPEFGKVEGQVSLLVHFGAGDYSAKFRVVTDNFQQWRADVGRVYSVDLRFQRQVVVNPETPAAQSLLGGKAAGTRR
jgi:cell division protein FtsQ